MFVREVSGQRQQQVRRPWGRKEQCGEKIVSEGRMRRDEVLILPQSRCSSPCPRSCKGGILACLMREAQVQVFFFFF